MSDISDKIKETNENIAAKIASVVEDYYDGADDGSLLKMRHCFMS